MAHAAHMSMTTKKELAVAQADLLAKFETPAGRALMSTAERLDLVGMGLQFGEAFYGNTAVVLVEMVELGEASQIWQRFGEDIYIHVPNVALRQELTKRLTKCKWTQEQISSVFGVSQRTTSNDISKIAKSEGTEKPKQKPRGSTKPNPVDAEVVTTFTCRRCGEGFPWNDQREIDGQPHCEDCALDLEEAAAHGEQAPPPPPKSSEEERDEEELQQKIVGHQEDLARIAAKTPWTSTNLRKIVKTLSMIRELMDE